MSEGFDVLMMLLLNIYATQNRGVQSFLQTADQSPLKTLYALVSMFSFCPLPPIWYLTELLGHLPSVLGTFLWFLMSKISFALEEGVSLRPRIFKHHPEL